MNIEVIKNQVDELIDEIVEFLEGANKYELIGIMVSLAQRVQDEDVDAALELALISKIAEEMQ